MGAAERFPPRFRDSHSSARSSSTRTGVPDVARPLKIVWKDSAVSKERLGLTFHRIVDILERVAKEERDARRPHPLEVELR